MRRTLETKRRGFTLVELPAVSKRKRRAFTLVELLLVMSLVAMLMFVALPSVLGIFGAGADAQAHNLLSAQLRIARALAVQQTNYVGVHVQMADRPELEGTCYIAIVAYDPNSGTFDLADGYTPSAVPGGMAFGQINHIFVPGDLNGDGLADYIQDMSEGLLRDFTSFTIVFSPTGSVVRNVDGRNIAFRFDPDAPVWVFVENPQEYGGREDWLWDVHTAGYTDPRRPTNTTAEPGTTAVTMFKYIDLKLTPPAQRDEYLNRSGQFLPVNVHTGQLFQRR